jgi:hypothetical protein
MLGTNHACALEGRSPWPKGADNEEAWAAESKLKTLCGLSVGDLPEGETWVDTNEAETWPVTCPTCRERLEAR